MNNWHIFVYFLLLPTPGLCPGCVGRASSTPTNGVGETMPSIAPFGTELLCTDNNLVLIILLFPSISGLAWLKRTNWEFSSTIRRMRHLRRELQLAFISLYIAETNRVCIALRGQEMSGIWLLMKEILPTVV